jgi:surface polysaccharide O-acyltransferase-like enzyme
MQNRNYSLDSLKFLCVVLIVFLHIDTCWRWYILPITRCAVPCFFMISGYLIFREQGMKESIKRGIKRMAILLLWSTLLYAIIPFMSSIHHNDFSQFITWNDIWKLIILNENPFAGHLWYISAYLYVLIILFFVNRFNLWKFFYLITPLLLMVDLTFGKYSLVVWGREFPYIFVRNFMFVGIPCFMIGTMIKRVRKRILAKSESYHKIAMIGVLVFTFTSYLERYILQINNLNAVRENYIGSTLLGICLLVLALTTIREKSNIISFMGDKYSMYIYVFHSLVNTILISYIGEIFPLPGVKYLAPFYILISTIFMIFILRKYRIIK